MIPEAEIQEVKRSADILGLFRSYGLKPERKGKDWFASCPFHDDDTPSLSIDPVQNIFHCLGCGEKGNAYQLVQKLEGFTFPEAFEKVAAMQGIKPINGTKSANPVPFYTKEEFLPVLEAAYKKMRDIFITSPAANYYMNVKRGFEHIRESLSGHRASIEVGYCPTDFGRKLPKEEQDKLIQLGIMRDRKQVHLAACVVFPLRNVEGRIVGLYGRKIRGKGAHYYLPGPREGVFGIHNGQNDTVYITESVIDALSLNQIGVMSVLALHGVNGFTPVHEQWLKTKGIKTVYLVLDGDKPGREAAVKLQRQIKDKGYVCHKLDLPNDEDPNSFFCLAANKRGVKELEALPGYPKKTAVPEMQLQKQGEEYIAQSGDRLYTIIGLHARDNTRLKATVRVSLRNSPLDFHIDSPDFYLSGSARRFEEGVAKELGAEPDAIHQEVKSLIIALEKERMAMREGAKQPEKPVMTPKEKADAMAFLKARDLINRLIEHLKYCGYVGEEVNKLICYLVATSRKTRDPLGVVIQSSSGAGKSSLMDMILSFIPEEDYDKYSAITGQSLFYMEETELKHKILAIAEGEGAEKASYSLKLLISEKELNIASVGKDPESGRQITKRYYVEGPTSVFYTTSDYDVDPEMLNRCLVLHVDESVSQTEAILRQQRRARTLEGMREEARYERIKALHKNIQRLLRPIRVYNPYCDRMTFSPEQRLARRNQMKYLNLIDTIALLHQYQRPVKEDKEVGKYIEVTVEDIELANSLAGEVLGHSLEELPPQTQKVLDKTHELVKAICKDSKSEQSHVRLTRRQIREYTGVGHSQLAVHLQRLVELEYLVVHHGRNGSRFVYELIYNGEGKDGERFCMGLLDVKELRKNGKTR